MTDATMPAACEMNSPDEQQQLETQIKQSEVKRTVDALVEPDASKGLHHRTSIFGNTVHESRFENVQKSDMICIDDLPGSELRLKATFRSQNSSSNDLDSGNGDGGLSLVGTLSIQGDKQRAGNAIQIRKNPYITVNGNGKKGRDVNATTIFANNERVSYILRQMWMAADVNEDETMSEPEYVTLSACLYKAVSSEISSEGVQDRASEDWKVDANGADVMLYDHFVISMMNLCDNLGESHSELEMVGFLETLHEEIINVDQSGATRPTLKNLDDIQLRFTSSGKQPCAPVFNRRLVSTIMDACFFDHWKMNEVVADFLGVRVGSRYSDLQTTRMVLTALDKFHHIDKFDRDAHHMWYAKLQRCRAFCRRASVLRVENGASVARIQMTERHKQGIESARSKRTVKVGQTVATRVALFAPSFKGLVLRTFEKSPELQNRHSGRALQTEHVVKKKLSSHTKPVKVDEKRNVVARVPARANHTVFAAPFADASRTLKEAPTHPRRGVLQMGYVKDPISPFAKHGKVDEKQSAKVPVKPDTSVRGPIHSSFGGRHLKFVKGSKRVLKGENYTLGKIEKRQKQVARGKLHTERVIAGKHNATLSESHWKSASISKHLHFASSEGKKRHPKKNGPLEQSDNGTEKVDVICQNGTERYSTAGLASRSIESVIAERNMGANTLDAKINKVVLRQKRSNGGVRVKHSVLCKFAV